MNKKLNGHKRICVYCSSSNHVDGSYFRIAGSLGELLARQNYSLVYGGGGTGLMGTVARSVQDSGGEVLGVITKALNKPGIAYDKVDQMIVTGCMRERKAVMEKHADAFIGLPGGFGTLEEVLEVVTLKQLCLHNKPIVLVNTGNFYGSLIDLFERIFQEKFANSLHRKLYYIADDARSALDYINSYAPIPFPPKNG